MKKLHEENTERRTKIAARSRAWREEHPDKELKARADYRARNLEKLRAAGRKRREKHVEYFQKRRDWQEARRRAYEAEALRDQAPAVYEILTKGEGCGGE